MGIYKYTLRAATKTVPASNGTRIEIGQFKYGWKPFWGDERSPVINSLRAAADRAVDKLGGVELFVKGDWHDGQTVHWSSRAFAELTEEFTSCPVIGHLVKDSRGRWYLNLTSTDELLAEYIEIGVLNSDEGSKYYFTDRDRNGNERSIQFPPSLNLYQVITNAKLARGRSY